jgi:hypothetical protein
MTKGSDPVSPGHPRRLETLAAQARERAVWTKAELERRRGQPAGPGDLFVLPVTADLPVEWAVLERRPEGRGKLLVVPADTHPLAGAADVEVGEGYPGGPLRLRCRFGVWLDAVSFDPEHRSGVLASETVAAALDRHRQVESGSLAPSPLAEEVEADPEYREWIREVPERARELAAAGPKPEVKRFPSPSPKPAYALAAMFALVAVGLSLWVVRLSREVDRLSAPVFDMPSVEVELGQGVRGGTVVQVPREASHVLIVLVLDPSLGPGPRDGYLEILRRSGEPVWRSSRKHLVPLAEMRLLLPRRLLPDGDYRVRVYPESGFGARPLAEEALRVETAG